MLHRPLSVHFNVDLLVVPLDSPFKLYTDVNKLDYLEKGTTVSVLYLYLLSLLFYNVIVVCMIHIKNVVITLINSDKTCLHASKFCTS